MKPFHRAVFCTTILAAVALAFGCESKPKHPQVGEVITGKLTVNGKEPGGLLNVEFVSASDPSVRAFASADAKGGVSGRAPVGRCKVGIKYANTSSPKPGTLTPALTKPANAVDLLDKWTKPETSGVEVEVVQGQPLDINFK